MKGNFMENAPEAAAAAPQAPETEAPQTTNPEPAQAPDMHGFTSEQLADIDKFFKANGGFEKIKSKISNPAPAEEAPAVAEQPKAQEPVAGQPTFKTPEGAITPSEFLAKQYFQSLAGEEKYSAISQGIASGEYLKEMAAFGIQALNQDGSINDQKVRMYLDLKAQTVPAKSTSTEPNASPAPTVEYVEVGDKVNDINQAYAVLQQDAELRRKGLAGHPKIAEAEEFIKNNFSNKNK